MASSRKRRSHSTLSRINPINFIKIRRQRKAKRIRKGITNPSLRPIKIRERRRIKKNKNIRINPNKSKGCKLD